MFFFSKLISFVEKNVFPNSPHSVMFVKKKEFTNTTIEYLLPAW